MIRPAHSPLRPLRHGGHHPAAAAGNVTGREYNSGQAAAAGRLARRRAARHLADTPGGAMPASPPDRPGGPPPAPGEPAAGKPAPGGPGGTGPADAGCPHAPACPRPPARPRPLPDPAAVRLCLIPDSAPPYDTEVAPAGPPGRAGGPDGAAGAAHSAGPDVPGRADPPGPASPPKPPAAPGPPRPPGPAPGWPGQFAQVLAETLAGSRPPRQLVPWTTERARDRIRRLGPLLSAGQQPRVRRVVTFHPTADAMEMAVVVGIGKRVHALAVRLERGSGQAVGRAAPPGRWLCVDVEAA